MNDIVMRPCHGPGALRRMQELAWTTWTSGSRWHVGGLAWSRCRHIGRDGEWPTMLWERDGRPLAWGWTEPPGELRLLVHPRHPGLVDEVLGWFETVATGDTLSVEIMDGEGPVSAALTRRGYRPADGLPFFLRMAHDLRELPPVEPPAGFTVRHVRDDGDVPARAAAHRAAFRSSRVTEERYRDVMGAWPYRRELDCVAEAPDGRLVAYGLAWLDAGNHVGEFEPVGTHPDFRRMGLARAVCLEAMHRLRAAGARTAVVHVRGDAAHPGPARLYASLGFTVTGRTVTYSRDRSHRPGGSRT
ncbi:GNAT family N-acetyltransferase [Streptosporangium sandarakinum]